MDDISEGLEDGGISVVNEYDSDLPDAFIYQNHRVFAGGRGVDTDFVSGCSSSIIFQWGSVYGDAYLTDLDFIYKAESRKPDYEDCPVDVNDNAAVKKDDTEPGTPQKTKAGRTVRVKFTI
ncbi:unnamed protein product [Nesidiocoris tenuis]|uniref:Uncharacterized protein n=1 Tax=Nesidiocoris tenuis TaxID=355587 RepID=A0A6H5HW89_9HEMI|nr:unnamed protein product [Nesidiocoris tenuis]